jgi:MYXO-CTERM domain-containing protein
MNRFTTLSLALAAAAAASTPAFGILNEFSIADGYNGAFSTPVWTYHPNWSLYSGTTGSNYVAQHGYGAGFPFGEPFGLVVRNDNGGSNNFILRYNVDAGDIGGANPSNVSGQRITIGFDANGYYGSGNITPSPMVTLGFGGTPSNPGMQIALSNNTRFMYSDPSNNLIESPIGLLTYWNRVSLTMDFNTNTYDLSMSSCTGNTQLASNTWTILQTFPIVTNAPFANNITSLNDMWWSVGTDPTGVGFQKNFFDHFTGRAVVTPTPGATALLAAAGLVTLRRRRR